MSIKIEIEVTNCLDCPKHQDGYDPDPHDSFNADDMYCACTLVPNDLFNKKSQYVSDRQPFKVITRSARPYQLRKECAIPKWCPFGKNL